MRHIVLCLILSACASSPGREPPASPAPSLVPSDALVPFASPESMTRLERSRHKADFFVLANHFEGQQHGGLCGPTSAVIVLNALRIDQAAELPVDQSAVPEPFRAQIPPKYDPYFHRYTQRTFFADPRVAAVKSEAAFYGTPSGPDAKPDPGMQLRQLHGILVALGVDSTLRVLDASITDDAARKEIADNLGRPATTSSSTTTARCSARTAAATSRRWRPGTRPRTRSSCST